MNPVKVRNVEIGTGLPKICVPIVGVTKDNIEEWATQIAPEGWITMEQIEGGQ